MTKVNNAKQPPAHLVKEEIVFTRTMTQEGELVGVKVTTTVQTPTVLHDNTQTVTIGGQTAADTFAAIRVIINNLQLTLMNSQREAEEAKEAKEAEESTAQGTTSTTLELINEDGA